MKTINNVTIYKCGYCNKKYFVKNACIKHEDACMKNPDNYHPCFECRHLDKKEYYDDYYRESFTTFYCDKKEINLKPLTSLKRNKTIPRASAPEIQVMPKVLQELF